MFKIQDLLFNWKQRGITTAIMPVTVGMALVAATTAPVSAQSVVVFEQDCRSVTQTGSNTYIVSCSPQPYAVPVRPHSGRSYFPGRVYYNNRRYNSGPNGYQHFRRRSNYYYNSPGRRTVVTPIPPAPPGPPTIVNPAPGGFPGYRGRVIHRRVPRGYYYR